MIAWLWKSCLLLKVNRKIRCVYYQKSLAYDWVMKSVLENQPMFKCLRLTKSNSGILILPPKFVILVNFIYICKIRFKYLMLTCTLTQKIKLAFLWLHFPQTKKSKGLWILSLYNESSLSWQKQNALFLLSGCFEISRLIHFNKCLNSASVLHHTHTILTYTARFLINLYLIFMQVFWACDISK